ncbi:MAG: hypothetical protein J0H64_05800, partial [Actinobacteria bacterium]|nr:hypothetical protein [Actinomycetota bacterium]
AGKTGGSASPEAPATKLVDSLAQGDPLALYGSLAPSEFQLFEPALKRLGEATVRDAHASADQMVQDLRGAVTVKVDGVETKTKQIVANEVERVTFTAGTVTFDGDADTIVDIVMDYLEDSYEGAIPRDQLVQARSDMRDRLDLPYTIDFADLRRQARESSAPIDGVSLVSVHEAGGWYVSPLMSYADLLTGAPSGRQSGRLGDRIVAAKASASPEAAAKDLTAAVLKAVNSGFSAQADIDAIAERLPLPERRLISVYGTAYGDGSRPSQTFTVASDEFSSTQQDGQARLRIDDLQIGAISEDQGLQLYNGITIKGLCATTHSEWVEYGSSYLDPYSDPQKQSSDSDPACLDASQAAKQLGLDRLSVIAVPEGGGWFVSPIATLADAATTVSDRLVKLAEAGKLEDTFRPENWQTS